MLSDLDLSSDAVKDKRFPAVDIVKFVCAFLVIAIHVAPLTDVNGYLNYGIVNYISRLAVPFFFIAGGFFCFRKTSVENFDKTVPNSYAKNTIKLYLIWTVIYFPIILYNNYVRGGVLHQLLLLFGTLFLLVVLHTYGICLRLQLAL
ncbi:MAG: acyltransferase [Lachnospiraceae bacterium]|nr:acyltransferase [Lachnospiraceae bacterium]